MSKKLVDRQIKIVEELQKRVLDDPGDVNVVNSLASSVIDLVRLREAH